MPLWYLNWKLHQKDNFAMFKDSEHNGEMQREEIS